MVIYYSELYKKCKELMEEILMSCELNYQLKLSFLGIYKKDRVTKFYRDLTWNDLI